MFIYLEGGILQGVRKKNKYDMSQDDQHHLLLWKLCDPYQQPNARQQTRG